jgi:hypothetical protein
MLWHAVSRISGSAFNGNGAMRSQYSNIIVSR